VSERSERGERDKYGRERRRPRSTRSDDPAVARRGRKASTGSATGAIARPAPRAARRGNGEDRELAAAAERARARGQSRRDAGTGRKGAGRSATSRGRAGSKPGRYGDAGVASLGEARAHRRLRHDAERAEELARLAALRGSRPDPRQRARRQIRTTRPLLSGRLGAGRPRFRLISTLVALLLVLAAVLAKVALLQGGGQAAALRSAGAAQWTRTSEIPARRGAIFDRNGNELAMSVPARTVVVNPLQVVDAAGTALQLAQILGLDDAAREELEQGILSDQSKGRGFRYVARQIDPSIAENVDALDLAGVDTYSEDRRIMPGGSTGLSVVGLTDIDGNGVSGLELQYGDGDDTAEADDLLVGRSGLVSREVAPGNHSIAGTETVTREPVPGVDLITTLDRSIQYTVERELVEYVGQVQALGGQVIVMGTNGDVYAMVSVTRDSRGVAVVDKGNWTAVGSYEPGSVGKVITMAGALNDGVVTPDEQFYVEDNYDCTVDPTDQPLRDSHPHPPEMMSATDILVESSNVGTIKVSRELGQGSGALERLYHYMTAFGLGSRTSLNFPGESAGILEPWQQWEGTERCTVAYGSGFAATPIQLAAAVNVIANDGVYAGPRLVSGTVGADGTVTELPAADTREVVSPEAAQQMQQMMRAVVCRDDGTANQARVPGLSVAGKTGTAYKAQADGTYFNAEGTRNYYLSFVGFFPAEDPQVTILVSIDDPPHGTSGGQAAAPLFAELVPTIVSELGIQPPAGSTGCDGD